LTIQEAQLVSWKIFRKINDKHGADSGKAGSPLAIISDLIKETGEISNAVNNLKRAEPGEEPKTKETLTRELNKLLFSVLILAEHYGINLEESFLEHVNDYLLDSLI